MSKEYEEYIKECIKLSKQCGEWWENRILGPINLAMCVLDAIESSFVSGSPECEKMRAFIKATGSISEALEEIGFRIFEIGWDLKEEFRPRPPSPESDYEAMKASTFGKHKGRKKK